MLWAKNDEADKRIRRMVNSYARSQVGANGVGPYSRTLLEFTGMSLEEFELWATRGLVSDRWLRVFHHGDVAGKGFGPWLTWEQAAKVPLVASPLSLDSSQVIA